MKFVTANQVADNICTLLGDETGSRKALVLRWVARSVQELNIHIFPMIVSKLFEIESSMQVILPPDCVRVTKVGAMDSDGRIVTFYPDSKVRPGLLAQLKDKEVCDNIEDGDSATSVVQVAPPMPGNVDPTNFIFYNAYLFGNRYYGELYGYRLDPGHVGTYWVDERNNTINFGSGTYSTPGKFVLVEYSALNAETYRMIPVEAQGCIEERTLYHLKKGVNSQNAQIHYRNFKVEYDQLKRHYLAMTPEQVIRPFLAAQTSGVK